MPRIEKKRAGRAKEKSPAQKSVRRTTARRGAKKSAHTKTVRRVRTKSGAHKVSGRHKSVYKYHALHLAKFPGNPIIAPSDHPWESRATFNPGAIYENGSVHLLYRAIGDSDVSVLGYAASKDGLRIDTQLDAPAYAPRELFEGTAKQKSANVASWATYNSGGGTYGGCEDPRLVKIGDRIYLTYTAFDGWSAPRVALSSIDAKDFFDHEWDWDPPVLISPPNEAHKNWVLFPEKIHGKYAILHSLCPTILIDYRDTLEFDGTKFIESVYGSIAQKNCWDTHVRGVGPPPLKTKDGWLVFYHAIDGSDPGKYKLGAMLLDLNNPSTILCRASEPILEPSEHYENGGWKPGVIYCCGAVIKNGELFIYYGGSDTVACVATAHLETFLGELKRSGIPKMHPKTVVRVR